MCIRSDIRVIKIYFKEHCAKSKEVFNEEGEEFHKWIDSYKPYGYRHRQVLHHKEGVEIGVQLFGEKARKHLEQHIKDDYHSDKIPTIHQLRNSNRTNYPNGIKVRSKYIIQKNNGE